jgi:hypothetical protein
MNRSRVTRFLASVFLSTSIAASLLAEDITTRSGKVFKEAILSDANADSVTIKHSGGSERVSLADLPEAIQKRYQFNPRQTELQRKAGEVEKLKDDLARAQAELKKLKADNDRLRTENAASQASVQPKPSKPLADVPAPNPADVIEVRDLALYYKADRASADQRFKDKTFRIQGTIERFSQVLLLRYYDILLESPDRSSQIVCSFSYPARFSTVYSKDHGQILVGADSEKRETPLLKAGTVVTVEGKCKGWHGSEVKFNNCKIVR